MIRGMRFVNGLLIILIIIGGATSIAQNPGDWARTIGSIVGIALWGAPFYLAWRSLNPDSKHGLVKAARTVNKVVFGLITLGFLSVIFYSKESMQISNLLPILIFAIPLALNIKALNKRETECMTSATTVSAPLSEPLPTSNYFVRHWRGELSLPVSYWVNGAILTTIASVILFGAAKIISDSGYSLRVISLVGLSVVVFSVVIWLWSVVGIWRSAGLHVTRGGESVWAGLAKIMVVLGFIAMGNQLINNLIPMGKEYALIAIGYDPLGKIDVKVSTNGKSVIVVGAFGEGSAAEIERILDAAPNATSLVLNSRGGRLHEAQRLARTVRSRNIDTYVESLCVSACTYVFLAGKDRAATPNAKIGFHQPMFPGFDAESRKSITRDMMDVYRTAGLPEAFIQRISKTSPDDMWYPTREELIDSNVVTRVSLGGEAATLWTTVNSKSEYILIMKNIPLFQAYERRFPGTISKAVDQGWTTKENGGNDARVMSVIRSVFSATFIKVIQTADDATLDGFADLFVGQLSAAKAVSDEACVRLINGELDITKTLPKEIVEREMKYTEAALEKPQRADMSSPDPAKVDKALQLAVADLTQLDLDAIDDIDAYTDQPNVVCDAFIALYQGVQALPYNQRIYVLRGMFQSEM